MSSCGSFGSMGCSNDNSYSDNDRGGSVDNWDYNNNRDYISGRNNSSGNRRNTSSGIPNVFEYIYDLTKKVESPFDIALKNCPVPDQNSIIYEWNKKSSSWSNNYSGQGKMDKRISDSEVDKVFKELESLPNHILNKKLVYIFPVVAACIMVMILAFIFISIIFMREYETFLTVLIVLSILTCLVVLVSTPYLTKLVKDHGSRMKSKR